MQGQKSIGPQLLNNWIKEDREWIHYNSQRLFPQKWEGIFAQFVLNSWKDVSLDLVKISLKTEAKFYRKPLT